MSQKMTKSNQNQAKSQIVANSRRSGRSGNLWTLWKHGIQEIQAAYKGSQLERQYRNTVKKNPKAYTSMFAEVNDNGLEAKRELVRRMR